MVFPSLLLLFLSAEMTRPPPVRCPPGAVALDETEQDQDGGCRNEGRMATPRAVVGGARLLGVTALALGLTAVVCPALLLGAAGAAYATPTRSSSNGNAPCAVACTFCCRPSSACAFRLCGLGFTQLLQCNLFSACIQTCVLCAFAAV